MREWGTFTQELVGAQKIRGGERLRPAAAATSVRLKAGKPLLTDGPFAATVMTSTAAAQTLDCPTPSAPYGISPECVQALSQQEAREALYFASLVAEAR